MLDYLAATVPNDAYAVMQSFDPTLPRPESPDQMATYLRQFVSQEGERGMRMLAKIHPDRSFFGGDMDDDYDNADGYGTGGERRRSRDRDRDPYHCACGCGLSNMTVAPNPYSNFYGANGGGNSGTGEAIQQSLTLLVGGALVMIVVTHALKALS